MTKWKAFVVFICGLSVAWASACHSGDRVPIDGSCKAYMECENGLLVEKKCGFLESFDVKTLTCRWSYHVDCVEKSKECDDGKLYSHPGSCKLYYVCRAGRLVLQFCPILEVFSQEEGKCKFGLSCTKTECVAEERRAVPGDCGKYDQCSNGTWKRSSCFIGKNYNAVTQACEIGGCSQCTDKERSPGAACNTFQYCEFGRWHDDHCGLFRRYDPAKKSCVWWFQYTCPKAVTFRLQEGKCEEGSTRAEQDCAKYSICQGNGWVGQSCPDGYLFDSVSDNCKPAAEATCKYCSEDTADREDCSYYHTCELGRNVRKKCPLLKKWDGVTKKCVFDWSANCFPGDSCEGGSRATADCKVYEECLGGSYYKKSCGVSSVYDATKQKCVWVWPWTSCKTTDLMSECSEGDRKILSCDQYVQCEKGTWNIKTCQEGYTFRDGECVRGECSVVVKDCDRYAINDVEMECVPGENFDEETRQCGKGTCKRAKRAVSECNEGERVAIKDECHKYQVCRGGQLVEERCSDCMNFDPEDKTCKFIFNYACREPTGPTTKPTQPPTQPTAPPTQPTEPPASVTTVPTQPTEFTTLPAPLCDEGATKPNDQDCKKYFECHSEKWVPKSCSWLKKFDSVKLECVFFGAHCAKPPEPTTQPPEPTTLPTEPPTQPTEPPTKPTEPPTQPSEPSTQPTQPTTQPTEPPTQPSDMPTQPTDEPTQSTEIPTRPTDKSTQPTEEPPQPTDQPAQPTDQPAQPTDQPAQPTDQPAQPTDQPAQPTDQPAQPTEQPAQPTDQPAQPTDQPAQPTNQPAQPTDQPAQPTEPPADSTTPDKVCTDGERRPDLTDCKKYYVCSSGEWNPDRCMWFRDFDSEELRCVNWGAKCAK